MRIGDLTRLASERKSKSIAIFNPLKEDFIVKFGDKNYTAFSQEVTKFSWFPGMHLKKHLIQHIINVRGITEGNHEDTAKEIEKEIKV